MEIKLPAGMRNNNPGNIKYTDFSAKYPGAIGPSENTDQGDPQVVFDTPENGMRAAAALALRKWNRGKVTIDDLIAGDNGWTPGNYQAAANIAAKMGVKASEKVDLSQPQQMASFLRGLVTQEHGPASKAYSDDLLLKSSYVGANASPTSAAAAVNALANGTLPEPHKVQTVAYVAPPFSADQPQFAPLIGTELPKAANDQQQPYVVQVAPVEPPAHDDMLKAWGLDGSAPVAPEQAPAIGVPTDDGSQAPAPLTLQSDPNADLVKAWGLDATDAAPAESLVNDGTVGPTIARGGKALPTPISVNDSVRALATGVPVIGGLLNKMDAGTNALIAPLVNPLLSDENKLQGDTFGERYANSLAQQEGMDTKFATEHPIANTALNVTGGVAATVPMMVAAPALMGVGEGGVVSNMLMGGIGGATIGGTDAAIRSGGDLRHTATGAALGLAFGAGAPAAGKVIGAVGNKLVSAASNMTPKGSAARNLAEAISSSDTTAGQIAAETARNPRLTPMDVDPNLNQMAMNLANQGGGPRATLNAAVENRMAGAKDAVTGAFDEALGTTPDVQAYLNNLKTTAKANAKTGFGEALDNAKPVNVTPVLEHIDSEIAPGVQASLSQGSNIPVGPVEQALAKVRAQLSSGNEMLTDAQRLHQIQSDLRVQADTLAKSTSGQDKLVASALRDVRAKIVGAIDEASGGKYKPAQAQYADDMSIQDAFDKGRQILSNGTSSDSALMNRPEYWTSWVKEAAPAEVDAAKVGARVAIDHQINSVRSAAAKGSAVPEVGFNRERLEILLGKKETDKLAQTLADEQKIAQTNAKLFAGSQTAPRQAVNKLTAVTEVTPGIRLTTPLAGLGGFQVGGLPGAAVGVGLSLAGKGAQMGARVRDLARNRLLADAISGRTSLEEALAPNMRGVNAGNALQRGTTTMLARGAPSSAAQVNRLLLMPQTVPAQR
jgi:hypothetical protein